MNEENTKQEPKFNENTKNSKMSDPINTTRNGILSIIGAIFHRLGIMSMMAFMGFSTYMISYLRRYQSEDETPLSLNYTYFIMPILTITIGIGVPFSGVLEYKMGTRLLIVYGSLYLILSSVIQYFSKVVYLNFFAIFIFAIGFSLSIAITGKNACMYFPTRRGLISGILSCIQAIFGSILNIFGEKVIINPKSIEPFRGFYTFEAAQNITKYYLFQIGCVTICTIIGVSLIVGYKLRGKRRGPRGDMKKKADENITENIDSNGPLIPDNEKEEEEKEKENEEEKEKENNENEENNDKDAQIKVNEKESTVNYSMNQVKHAARSFRVWRLFLMNIFSAPLNNFIMIAWRPISIYKEMPTNIIQNVNSFTSITQMFITPLFGYLSDKIPFRVMKIILGILNFIAGILFYFSFKNVYFFVGLIILNSFANHGTFALNEPHYMKVFGMKHVIEISGIIGLANVIMGPICSISAFLIEQNLKEKLDEVYCYMFIISSLLVTVDIGLSFFETEEPLFE
jgi:MFS family permease